MARFVVFAVAVLNVDALALPGMPPRVPVPVPTLASTARLTAAINRGAARRSAAAATAITMASGSGNRFESWEDYAYTVYGNGAGASDEEAAEPFFDTSADDLGLHR